MSENASQIAQWNDGFGRTWAELSPLLDRQLAGVGRTTIDALAPRRGERILDVGCGCGRTTLDLAARVGPEGAAVGLDVSRPMLAVARDRAAAAGLAHVRFLEDDAQEHAFEPASFDALFSCFGVMFFADPVAAFRNLRRALRPGGRLAFTCWRAAAENPVMTRPMDAARHRFPPLPAPAAGAPGPFAFADQAHVQAILEGAGFAEVSLRRQDADMGGNTLEDTLTLATRVGPLASALRECPGPMQEAREDVRAALLPFVREGAVWQASSTWIVTAASP